MTAGSDRNVAGGGGGFRRRMRGICSGKTGKTIGFASIAAPIVGFVINDLKKPDSVIRALAATTMRRLLPEKANRPEEIDISDKVKITEIKSDKGN